MYRKRTLAAALAALTLALSGTVAAQTAPSLLKSLIIASTTSVRDTGFLDEFIPQFIQETGVPAKYIAVGTGQAMKMGQEGEADLLLVHAKPAELEFMAQGYGIKRSEIMHNDFVLVGPPEDPSGIRASAPQDVVKAFRILAAQNALFISRGDNSGTQQKENQLWKAAGLKPQFTNYLLAGLGMADVLKMAYEKRAYTLTDRGTYLKMSKTIDLAVLVEGDPALVNLYSAIVVNPSRFPGINAPAAEVFLRWIVSAAVQKRIGEFAKEIYGRPLFIPCAENNP